MTHYSDDTSPIMGHEVLQLLAEMGGDTQVEHLKAAVLQRYGVAAVFTNCAGNLFNFEELLSFLESRQKLVIAGQQVRLGAVPACSHP